MLYIILCISNWIAWRHLYLLDIVLSHLLLYHQIAHIKNALRWATETWRLDTIASLYYLFDENYSVSRFIVLSVNDKYANMYVCVDEKHTNT